jgi:hypothetical protein
MVSTYLLAGGQYIAASHDGAGEVAVGVLPGCSIDFKEVFGAIDDTMI